jgi:hypothetical protein
MSKLEDYIVENNVDERMAYVLRDYKRGYKELHSICLWYSVNIDRAVNLINTLHSKNII